MVSLLFNVSGEYGEISSQGLQITKNNEGEDRLSTDPTELKKKLQNRSPEGIKPEVSGIVSSCHQ